MKNAFSGVARKVSLIVLVLILIAGVYFLITGITGFSSPTITGLTTYEIQAQSTTATIFGIILILISLIYIVLYLRTLE